MVHLQAQIRTVMSSPTISIPPSMKPKLFAGDTIASAEGAPSKMSPWDICQQKISQKCHNPSGEGTQV